MWVDIGRNLIVQHAEEILRGHIRKRGVHLAVATAVATLKVTAQGALPK